MTRGIQVIWPGENGNPNKPDEIEFFHGIDVDHLDQIPKFTKVPTLWPQYEGGIFIEYTVDTCCKPLGPGEVHLFVHYDRAAIEVLVRQWDEEIYPGTNKIILRQGEQNGICHWQIEGSSKVYEVPWKAFDLGANQAPRPLARYFGSRREAQFRKMILNCDKSRCVLTGETTKQALDAAHLIPAAMGENDMPFNGITLRADLHRLFDACLFTIKPNGKVKILKRDPGLSEAYIQLLRNARLPEETLRRVRGTLASPEFQNRCQ